jgi:RNA polymerase sigma factor (sigma-70 family)
MPVAPNHAIESCLDRIRGGDASARTELLDLACKRLQQLAHKMMGDYRGLRRWQDSDDVLHSAVVRLCRALQEVTPVSARHFFRLAALQIRRELLDLARHYRGAAGADLGLAGVPADGASLPSGICGHGSDSTYDPERLAVWAELHRRAEALPEGERDVFELLWYHDLTQAEAAALLGVCERTIIRRWQAARLKLAPVLQGSLAGL